MYAESLAENVKQQIAQWKQSPNSIAFIQTHFPWFDRYFVSVSEAIDRGEVNFLNSLPEEIINNIDFVHSKSPYRLLYECRWMTAREDPRPDSFPQETLKRNQLVLAFLIAILFTCSVISFKNFAPTLCIATFFTALFFMYYISGYILKFLNKQIRRLEMDGALDFRELFDIEHQVYDDKFKKHIMELARCVRQSNQILDENHEQINIINDALNLINTNLTRYQSEAITQARKRRGR